MALDIETHNNSDLSQVESMTGGLFSNDFLFKYMLLTGS